MGELGFVTTEGKLIAGVGKELLNERDKIGFSVFHSSF
jgi:hypothetical protein